MEITAPYSYPDNVPDYIKDLPAGGQKMFIEAFNKVLKETGDEDKARQAGWRNVKLKYHKEGDKWVKSTLSLEAEEVRLFQPSRKDKELVSSIGGGKRVNFYIEGVYTLINQKNGNGYKILLEDTQKALPSIISSPLSLNHYPFAIGTYYDAKIVNEKDKYSEIIVRAVGWRKHCREGELVEIKKAYADGTLAMSWEIPCDDEMQLDYDATDDSHIIKNYVFSGGALIAGIEPAYQDTKGKTQIQSKMKGGDEKMLKVEILGEKFEAEENSVILKSLEKVKASVETIDEEKDAAIKEKDVVIKEKEKIENEKKDVAAEKEKVLAEKEKAEKELADLKEVVSKEEKDRLAEDRISKAKEIAPFENEEDEKEAKKVYRDMEEDTFKAELLKRENLVLKQQVDKGKELKSTISLKGEIKDLPVGDTSNDKNKKKDEENKSSLEIISEKY